MKFLYQYRTPDNCQHDGVIRAASRDAAYAALKAKGIRPSRMEEASGFFNKLFGKGKRWLAIAVLAAAVAISLPFALRRPHVAEQLPPDCADRAQLYGDPVVISECMSVGWTNVFSSAFDCFLAVYAIPGDIEHVREWKGPEPMAKDIRLTPIDAKDLAEIQRMKRMVNGLKREYLAYIADGGTFKSYFKRLVIRQKAENALYENARRQINRTNDRAVWRMKNAELRAMGLPMYEPSEDAESNQDAKKNSGASSGL